MVRAVSTDLLPKSWRLTLVRALKEAILFNSKMAEFDCQKPKTGMILLHNIRALGSKYDAILLQETKYVLTEDRKLGLALEGWTIFHSNHDSRNTGGVTTCVSKAITDRYKVVQINTSSSLNGRVLLLRLSPMDPDSGDKTVVLGNVYLSAKSVVERRQQLVQIAAEEAGDHNIFLGDWNTILREEESTGSNVQKGTAFRDAWDLFLTKFGLPR